MYCCLYVYKYTYYTLLVVSAALVNQYLVWKPGRTEDKYFTINLNIKYPEQTILYPLIYFPFFKFVYMYSNWFYECKYMFNWLKLLFKSIICFPLYLLYYIHIELCKNLYLWNEWIATYDLNILVPSEFFAAYFRLVLDW